MSSSRNNSQQTSGGISVTQEECEKMIDKSLRNHPTVKFLKKKLEEYGCPISRNFIRGENCKQRDCGGSYVPGIGIVVCCNNVRLQDEVNQTVIHHLINAYDDCRAANMKWTDCAHQACSQIRANHLSGDCHYKRELLRGFTAIRGHEQDCVRRRVMKAFSANPKCSGEEGKMAMEAVWDTCYNDTKPFDRAP